MEKMSFVGVLLVVLLLLHPSREGGEGVMVAEGRMCASQSHGFKGTCVRNHNCAQICRLERFSGGECQGFRRRCFCTRSC